MLNEKDFLSFLDRERVLFSDGAMGTLISHRLPAGQACLDYANITHPQLIAGVHQEYLQAGVDMIQTNTFGANRFKLSQHALEGKLEEINAAGVKIARQVADEVSRQVFIAGDIGPLGVRIAPFGRLQLTDAHDAFKQQAAVLLEAGADLLIIETMTDLYETVEAISAARDISVEIPIIASMTFTRDNRTLLGDSPARVVQQLSAAGATVIGVNCSAGPNQILNILKAMRQAQPEALFSVMPNAGWPEQVEGRIMYPAAPDYFGSYALSFWQAGASVIGGCCGTTPAHIAAMVESFRAAPHLERQPLEALSVKGIAAPIEADALQPTQLAQKLADGKFVIAVEMDPPRGLSTHKLIAGASLLAEAGADVIDVADSPMARMRMSPWAVCSLIQRQIGIETVLHFPTRGRNVLRVQGDLLAAHALEVRNIFVVMGDPTSIGDYPDAMDHYDLVPSGLIKLVKQGFNAGMDHSGNTIGQPTSFFAGCALNLKAPDMSVEIKNLRRKLKSGADFILTQPIYHPALVTNFLDTYEAEHGALSTPLIVGLLPLASARHAAFLQAEVPGIEIPPDVRQLMDESGDQGARVGIRLTVELIDQIKPLAQGIYLMPAFQRFDYAAEIIEKTIND